MAWWDEEGPLAQLGAHFQAILGASLAPHMPHPHRVKYPDASVGQVESNAPTQPLEAEIRGAFHCLFDALLRSDMRRRVREYPRIQGVVVLV